MNRTRINIDVDEHQHQWLELTARVVGATKTEVARALVEAASSYAPPATDDLEATIKKQRLLANQKRGRTQTDRRQVQRESTQSHPPE